MTSSQNNLANSPFFSLNETFIAELYQKYLKDKTSVDPSWAEFFARSNSDNFDSTPSDYSGPSWARRKVKVVGAEKFDSSSFTKVETKPQVNSKAPQAEESARPLNERVRNLISAYRKYGHLIADLDPLGLDGDRVKACFSDGDPDAFASKLNLKTYKIAEEDLAREVEWPGTTNVIKLGDLIENLNYIYTQKVGLEFAHVRSEEQKRWLWAMAEQKMLEETSIEEKRKILKEVVRTERFEQFIHKRFPGAKRFSIEGGDAMVSAVEKIIEAVAANQVEKVIIGMAHRGRLNVLTNVIGKPYHQIIAEFQGTAGISEAVTRAGDVKYHMGYSTSRNIDGHKIVLSLAFNPSHLEAVGTVITGRVRATQHLLNDHNQEKVIALSIHGDAAFSGQGVVSEGLIMNGIDGYNTGGVIHIIINNQVGFTANPTDERSTAYASDLARAIDAPIFHANADDVESVVKIAEMMVEYRKHFKKDVVLDLVCYRRYGHNEGDEPLYTQPVMYSKIKDHPTLEKIYSTKLIKEKSVSDAQYQSMVTDFEQQLNSEFDIAKSYQPKEGDWLKGEWSKIAARDLATPDTSVAKAKLKELMSKLTMIPANFNLNPKIGKQLEARLEAVNKEEGIDWGCAEALAHASLLSEKFPVRLTGQDAGRGTFSHRHSVLHDMNDGNHYIPLNNLGNDAAKYEVYDSLLSEYGVLGFEYGYSTTMPYGLTIWEAQFGDFANGAQIVFDQFISAGEAKWLRKSGLVMLLPHGYEGQGPEHSSARLERFLQACANDNIIVANITNPANFFHILRRQLHSKDRKPLVIMSPKSLLRHKLAVSTLSEFSELKFRPLIAENTKLVADDKIKKVVICSGKVYYDLFEARANAKINDIAILRLEQIYPFPAVELKNELKKYKSAQIVWCQEEPRNMGSWKFVEELIEENLIALKHTSATVKYAGRVSAASPATGYAKYHIEEQKKLISEALA